MPKKTHPPVPTGTPVMPPASRTPRSFDPALAKGGKLGPAQRPGLPSRGKSANQLIHAQKPRGR